MEGKLVIEEKIEVTDIEMAKRILKTINDFFNITFDGFFDTSIKRKKLKK